MDLWTRAHTGSPVVTVEVGGEIDIESGPHLRERLCSVIAEHGPRLALDLTGVTFLDCSGVSALVAARKVAQTEGGWLRLTSVSRRARRLIELAGLQDTLAMSPAGPPRRPSRRPQDQLHLALVGGTGP